MHMDASRLGVGLGRGRIWPQGLASEGLEAAGAWGARHGVWEDPEGA